MPNPPLFVSYARADRAEVQQLVDALGAAGFAVWTDALLEGATAWSVELQRAIETCAAVVVVLSRTSVESAFVRKELNYAVSTDRPLVPVRIDDVPTLGDLALLVADVQIVEWMPGSPVDDVVDAVHRAAARRAYRRHPVLRVLATVLQLLGALAVVGGFAWMIYAMAGAMGAFGDDTDPFGDSGASNVAGRRFIVGFAAMFAGIVVSAVGQLARRAARSR